MTEIDHDQLAELMARMPDDPAALFRFVDVHGGRLAAIVRSHLRSFGRHDLARDDDEVQGTVWEVAFFLRERAPAWQPGNALPWTWARRGIRTVVANAAGHATADVDLDHLCAAPGSPARAADDDVDLDTLARHHAALALLRDALGVIACTPRDRDVHIEYRIQWSLGDPSPAHTVGEAFGLDPRNVRQIDRRVRRRVQLLAAADHRFAPLADLPWVTGNRADAAA